jgi:hypothetical protein
MKTFEVELRRTSFVLYTVEAETIEEAEDKAWNMLQSDDEHNHDWASWEVESIEEAPQ